MSRSVRSVVIVGAHPPRADLLDAMLVDTNDYVYLESIRKAYSRISRVTPDLVIVFQEIDDVAACRLLSMLKIDGAMSGIPVLTCAMRREESQFQDGIAELDWDSPSRAPRSE